TGILAASEDAYVYYATIINNETECSADAQLSITITDTPDVMNATASFCEEDQVNVDLSDYDTAVGGGDGYTVTWYSDAARLDEISATGILAASEDAYVYYATIINNETECARSAE